MSEDIYILHVYDDLNTYLPALAELLDGCSSLGGVASLQEHTIS